MLAINSIHRGSPMKTFVLTLIVALGVAGPAHAQRVDARTSEAMRGLGNLSSIVNETNRKTMGFDSVAEVGSATLGNPIAVFMVRLDQLRQYKGEEASQLLVDLQTFMYPVQVAGRVRTTVEVERTNGGWGVARIGGAQRIRAIDKHRAVAMKA